MLTGKMVRVRYAKNHVVPHYLETDEAEWREVAERLLEIYRHAEHQTRGEIEAEIRDNFGDSPDQLIFQGLAKLLEDRSEFAVVSGHSPEQVRAAVFGKAAAQRSAGADESAYYEQGELRRPSAFDRDAVLCEAAGELGMSTEEVENCLFADLRGEQQMVAFKDLSAERLLQRYNVGLAQAVLLRATAVQVKIRGEPPRRYRQLMRRLKFHRLMCELQHLGDDAWLLKLDGPLSLFSATQKYGFQLAVFLPVILQCKEFELEAELLWGPQRKPKKFRLSSEDGLVSHYVDSGMYMPPELAMFVELFRKKVDDWEIVEETELLPLGDTFWIPDYQLLHKESGQIVYLEVLGFWRRGNAEQHLKRLRKHAPAPFVLAVSDQLRVDESEWDGMPAEIYRFRQMPLAQEIAKAAKRLIKK